MGMYAVLCTVSPRRRELLEEEPELVADLVAQRRDGDVPGLLDLDKAWDALRVMLVGTEAEDAVLLERGADIGRSMAFGPAKIVTPEVVATLAAAMPVDPAEFVERRFGRLTRTSVHGRFGADPERADEDREYLVKALERLCELYREAAARGDGMLAVVV